MRQGRVAPSVRGRDAPADWVPRSPWFLRNPVVFEVLVLHFLGKFVPEELITLKVDFSSFSFSLGTVCSGCLSSQPSLSPVCPWSQHVPQVDSTWSDPACNLCLLMGVFGPSIVSVVVGRFGFVSHFAVCFVSSVGCLVCLNLLNCPLCIQYL